MLLLKNYLLQKNFQFFQLFHNSNRNTLYIYRIMSKFQLFPIFPNLNWSHNPNCNTFYVTHFPRTTKLKRTRTALYHFHISMKNSTPKNPPKTYFQKKNNHPHSKNSKPSTLPYPSSPYPSSLSLSLTPSFHKNQNHGTSMIDSHARWNGSIAARNTLLHPPFPSPPPSPLSWWRGSSGGRHGQQDVKGRRPRRGPGGNCRRGGRGPFSTGPGEVGRELGNPADCRRFAAPSTHSSLSLSSRCAPQPAITYLDDFQIGSGLHFFARCMHPSLSLSLPLFLLLSFFSQGETRRDGRGIDVNEREREGEGG